MYGIVERRSWIARNGYWLLIVALAVFAANQFTRNQNTDELIRVAQEKQALQAENTALQNTVANLSTAQAETNAKLETAYIEISNGINRIDALEAEKELAKLSVRLLRTDDDLVVAFKETFPAVARADSLGVIMLQDDGGIVLPYLSMPLWFAETFILEHNELVAAQSQLSEYANITALYGDAKDLHAEVLRLEKEKATAWQSGYQNAFARYDDLSTKYSACLNKPRIDLPSSWVVAGSAVAGFVGCTALQGGWKW